MLDLQLRVYSPNRSKTLSTNTSILTYFFPIFQNINLKKRPFREYQQRLTTLRKFYESMLNNNRAYLGNNKIWVLIDETSDAGGHYVVNVVIGT